MPATRCLTGMTAIVGERSYNRDPGSGAVPCSLFRAAFIQEFAIFPGGQIVLYDTRLNLEETQNMAPVTSSRSLRTDNIFHFVSTPSIATTIMHVASEQSRHESTLLSRASAHSSWVRLRHTTTERPGAANDALDGLDMKLALIKTYSKNLGSRIPELSRGAMITACHLVFEGRGGQELIDRVVRTIAWQDTQLLLM